MILVDADDVSVLNDCKRLFGHLRQIASQKPVEGKTYECTSYIRMAQTVVSTIHTKLIKE